jgi:hypothetical protein
MLLGFSVAAVGQQAQPLKHAPTAEQCRADALLWKQELRSFCLTNTRSGPSQFASTVGQMSVTELLTRETEMGQCSVVDESEGRLYDDVEDRIDDIVSARTVFYLEETKQVNQFSAWERTQQQRQREKAGQ